VEKERLKVGIIAAEHSSDRLGAKIIESLQNNKPLKPGSFRGRKNTAPEKSYKISGDQNA